jgi:hypothetical protein
VPSGALLIVHADDSLVVVDKPAGLLSVPGRGADKADNACARVQNEFADALTVHRLDMATSGLLLFARGASMQRQLSALFEAREVIKHYEALVSGLVEQENGEIDLPLAAIAARLGADVPACLASQTCWMAGIGDVLEPCAPLPEAGLVLANPGIGLATPLVFKRRSAPFRAAQRFGIPATVAEFARELGNASNDLAAAAQELVPEIGILLGYLDALPGARLARMSGSGATCFALFDSRKAARAAAKALELRVPGGWWVASGGWHKPPPSAVVRHVP